MEGEIEHVGRQEREGIPEGLARDVHVSLEAFCIIKQMEGMGQGIESDSFATIRGPVSVAVQ
jgi:hypothetical protein